MVVFIWKPKTSFFIHMVNFLLKKLKSSLVKGFLLLLKFKNMEQNIVDKWVYIFYIV